ncbi:hypothetical protein [Cupriavidus sp. UYPR2.512]|uniref:hypothetical protein n=1 Tax=Cupriavidus sp. UYPR2.512 TaxID=1080187 RepID=UPI0012FCCCE0|nr:hypothetical protein [Cupriavidus sp. UYPR2.512]UIF89992.1 hypothetical protein KAF44_40140 [Cupriavidus necator]
MQQPHPVEMHIQIVWSSVRLVLLQRVLYELIPDTRVDLWRVMRGASLDYGLIEWCKIFGNRSDDTHWTKLVPNDRHDVFRDGLLAAVGKSSREWEEYHSAMKDYRDQLAAHHDLDAKPTHYPSFDAALEAAYYYYATFLYPEWSSKNPATPYPPDMKAYAAEYREQLLKVAKAAAQATREFEPGH